MLSKTSSLMVFSLASCPFPLCRSLLLFCSISRCFSFSLASSSHFLRVFLSASLLSFSCSLLLVHFVSFFSLFQLFLSFLLLFSFSLSPLASSPCPLASCIVPLRGTSPYRAQA